MGGSRSDARSSASLIANFVTAPHTRTSHVSRQREGERARDEKPPRPAKNNSVQNGQNHDKICLALACRLTVVPQLRPPQHVGSKRAFPPRTGSTANLASASLQPKIVHRVRAGVPRHWTVFGNKERPGVAWLPLVAPGEVWRRGAARFARVRRFGRRKTPAGGGGGGGERLG